MRLKDFICGYFAEVKSNTKSKVTNKNKISVNEKLEEVKNNIRARQIVWHVCTPKSASTYFMNFCKSNLKVIEDGKNYKFVSAVPEYGNRPQVSCPYTLNERIGKLTNNTIAVTSHQHVLPTDDLLSLISENHKVIIQTRSISDTLVSLLDHFNQSSESNGPWLIKSGDYWKQLDDKSKIDLLIINYVPWHIQFLQGWIEAKNHSNNIYLYDFNEITNNPLTVFEEMFSSKYATENLNALVPTKQNSRFNKGVAGRGIETLDDEQIESIKRMLDKSDHFNQQLVRYL